MKLIFFGIIIGTLIVNSESKDNINGHSFVLLKNQRCETSNLLAILSNVRSRQICLGECVALAQCARVNYAKSSMTCELIPSNETTCSNTFDTNWNHAHFLCKNQYKRDCQTLRENGCRQNGVYTIKPDPTKASFDVFCDMHDGGWTVIQKRYDGSVEFHGKNWAEYRLGFGTVSTEYWLGNSKINRITNSANYQIKFDMLPSDNEWSDAIYSYFSIKNATGDFEMTIGPYVGGTAPDSIGGSTAANMLLNGMKFSTVDRDNDLATGACTNPYGGSGWWYNSCTGVNLNGNYSFDGIYHDRHLGVKWGGLTPYDGPSLMATAMKLKRQS
ncbi:unnamed protein product [Owenia fusiformis]|uniref:Uncharacterized protein n=1 Tax=Owenia fusiformis TaxID=6347 RepID=A0A8J1UQW8_OWEFU|nr:unnamed protein product [Owenia fusiformis]